MSSWPSGSVGAKRSAATRLPPANPTNLPEITLGHGPHARQYAPVLSPLCDFRGLLLGYLLVLPDMTELRRAQAQALEHERMLAVQSERERMARELHDSLGQVLSYTSLQVETAAQLALAGQGEAAAGQLARLGRWSARRTPTCASRSSTSPAPARSSDRFFTAARQYLDGFTRSYDIRTRLTVEPGLDDGRLPAGREAAAVPHPPGGALERAQARAGPPGAGQLHGRGRPGAA